ncbi:hypothetical protein [Clostridium tertium]|uniref:hypothetical protein n=1 Tax=Clostridium tertium TaxID=1559 RepID=UPI0022E62286|nr:hypothetical protein [Clostridium tertium]
MKRLYDLIKDYNLLTCAGILREAVNADGEIVSLIDSRPGYSVLGKRPATDYEIALTLGFNGVVEEYKNTMDKLLEIGVVKKHRNKYKYNRNYII